MGGAKQNNNKKNNKHKPVGVVYTSGVFDILHRGHLNILNHARTLGKKLTVGIQNDQAVFENKGYYPVLKTKERLEQMRSLPFVDEVIEYYSGVNQASILAKVKPDTMIQGDDWPLQADRTKVMQYLKDHGIKLVLVPYTKEISDTEIKRRIWES